MGIAGGHEVCVAAARQAGALNKRCQCEMGGKNPMVVLSDADLVLAIDATVQGAQGAQPGSAGAGGADGSESAGVEARAGDGRVMEGWLLKKSGYMVTR